jgi:Fur family ferric uptake transcriptional regulator
MNELRASLARRLRRRGMRVTAERRAILEHVFRHFGHFEPEDLLRSLRRHGIGVSRATVYRTLGQFVELGLLRRYDLGNRRAVYEPSFGRIHHEHLVCVECGRLYEFVQERIEQLQDEVCREHGFTPLRHTLQIQGICRDCLSATGEARENRVAAVAAAAAAATEGRR